MEGFDSTHDVLEYNHVVLKKLQPREFDFHIELAQAILTTSAQCDPRPVAELALRQSGSIYRNLLEEKTTPGMQRYLGRQTAV